MSDESSRSIWQRPAVFVAIGVAATVALALIVVIFLLRTGGSAAVADNAALIGALLALGGVMTTQMVSIALDNRRTQETRDIEERRVQEATLQQYFEQIGQLLRQGMGRSYRKR